MVNKKQLYGAFLGVLLLVSIFYTIGSIALKTTPEYGVEIISSEGEQTEKSYRVSGYVINKGLNPKEVYVRVEFLDEGGRVVDSTVTPVIPKDESHIEN